jgi:hypothetical protein
VDSGERGVMWSEVRMSGVRWSGRESEGELQALVCAPLFRNAPLKHVGSSPFIEISSTSMSP